MVKSIDHNLRSMMHMVTILCRESACVVRRPDESGFSGGFQQVTALRARVIAGQMTAEREVPPHGDALLLGLVSPVSITFREFPHLHS